MPPAKRSEQRDLFRGALKMMHLVKPDVSQSTGMRLSDTSNSAPTNYCR